MISDEVKLPPPFYLGDFIWIDNNVCQDIICHFDIINRFLDYFDVQSFFSKPPLVFLACLSLPSSAIVKMCLTFALFSSV